MATPGFDNGAPSYGFVHMQTHDGSASFDHDYALPASLDTIEPRARAIFVAGWRPEVPDGPTHADLAELCEAHQAGAA